MRRHFFTLLLLPVFILLLAPPFPPQSVASSANSERKLRFAAVVLDSHGAPIRDLRVDDFVLEVAGKPQSAHMQVQPPTADLGTTKGHSLIVVVVDVMHTRWVEEKDLRLYAGRYLAACAKSDAAVSLLVLSREGMLIPVHEYSTGSAVLAAALEMADTEMHHKNSLHAASPEIVAEADRFVDFYEGKGTFSSRQAIQEYPGIILESFGKVARYVAGIPGRKALIWISSTIPFAVEEKQGRILSPTTQTLTPGNLVYPDLLTPDQVRELQGIWKKSIGAMQSSGLALYPVQTRATAAVPIDPEVLHSMSGLAHMTGGLEVHSVGDFFGQFADLPEDNASAYELVIAADDLDCRSDWCEMKVTVKRPGAHVLAPQGFFRDTGIGPPETPAPVAATVAEPDPGAKGIPFTVTWKPEEDAGTKKKIPLVVIFSPAAGILAGGSTELNLEVIVQAFSNGTDKQALSIAAKTQLPQATIDQIRTKGFVLNNALELEPGEYDVHFLVHDKTTGRMGVLKVPLKVD